MRFFVATLLAAAIPAWAQAPAPAPPAVPMKGACVECGVVRSVKILTREATSTANEAKPSGLVATIPLGKTDEKPHIGSSSKLGRDVVTKMQSWEVTIRFDDGRFKVMTLNEDPELREGDKVR